jgi:hypothetical protein
VHDADAPPTTDDEQRRVTLPEQGGAVDPDETETEPGRSTEPDDEPAAEPDSPEVGQPPAGPQTDPDAELVEP